MAETYHGFIDTAHDALLIFEACNLGYLPRVQRRFSERERQTIRSGAVYVWDEEETGMRRWTDGRTWSPSRVHGCFLIYYELEGRRHQFINNGSGPRGTRTEASPFHMPYDVCPPNIMQKEQGLIKKALSLCTNDKRKLHLVCYYSREDVESGCLMSPTNDPRFADVKISEGRYPEIGHGASRTDRSSSRSRVIPTYSNYNQQRSTPGAREGPPAYARSSSGMGRKSPRGYRSEVYRYPSYGPYTGPVRHVHVPINPASDSEDILYQHNQQQRPAPQQQQSYAMRQPMFSVPGSGMPVGGSVGPEMPVSNNMYRVDRGGQAVAYESGSYGPPSVHQVSYSQHSPSYPTSPWQSAPQSQLSLSVPNPSSNPNPNPNQIQQYGYLTTHIPSSRSLSSPSSNHPVWQQSEPPRTYVDQPSINARPSMWGSNTKGLMIQVADTANSQLATASESMSSAGGSLPLTPLVQNCVPPPEFRRPTPYSMHGHQTPPTSTNTSVPGVSSLRPSSSSSATNVIQHAPSSSASDTFNPHQVRLPPIARLGSAASTSMPASPSGSFNGRTINGQHNRSEIPVLLTPGNEDNQSQRKPSSSSNSSRWSPYSIVPSRSLKKPPSSPSLSTDSLFKINSEDARQLAALKPSLN